MRPVHRWTPAGRSSSPSPPPVYVLLTRESLTTRWFRYGSWDRAKGGSAEWALHVAEGTTRSGDRLIFDDGAVFDVDEGGALELAMPQNTVGNTGGNTVAEAVGTLATHEGGQTREIDYGHPEGLRIDWRPGQAVATIATANVGRSVFHRLFVQRKGDGEAFRPVAVDDPAFALWEVVAQSAARKTAGRARSSRSSRPAHTRPASGRATRSRKTARDAVTRSRRSPGAPRDVATAPGGGDRTNRNGPRSAPR